MAELEALVPWLSLAERLALVFDERQEPALMVDEDLKAVAALERDEIADGLGNVVATSTVTMSLQASVDDALRAVGAGDPPAPFATLEQRRAAGPGPWIQLDGRPWIDEWWRLRCLRAGVAVGATISLLDRHTGNRIDLESGASTPLPELVHESLDVVALPGAESWLSQTPRKPREPGQGTLRIRGDTEGPPMTAWGQPMGCSPDGQVVWSGYRCVVQWNVIAENRVSRWTHGRIRWPDTHAKKLFGHMDNIGLWVDLAPDASACLSVMEHDALLTPGLPVRWMRAGDTCVAQGVMEHPLRALFFQYTGLYDVPEAECVNAEEEVRGRRATISLGPDEERRYVVGFDANTWRVIGDRSKRIGVAGGGYAVFDSQHRVTGWGPERMWAGWDRWLLLETSLGALERLDLLTEKRERLVALDRELEACIAVPGSPNFLLVAPEASGIAVRLV